MAESVALAVLENLVHMKRQDFPSGYVVVCATFSDRLETVSIDQLRTEQPSLSGQALGDHWFDNARSAVLRVRSVIVPSESNYLLNPRHRDFSQIVAEVPLPFAFDQRLFGSLGNASKR